jgi:hypothetical protein
MNVGSTFELANRTGLWVFCGVRSQEIPLSWLDLGDTA